MMQYILPLLLAFIPLFSHFEYDPHVYFEGCVNVQTGDFVFSENDLVVEDIPIKRVYESSEIVFRIVPQKELILRGEKGLKGEIHVTSLDLYEPNGSILTYIKKDNQFHLQIPKGFANTARGQIGGQTNLLNQKLVQVDSNTIKVITPSQTIRLYKRAYPTKKDVIFLLQSEGLPDGSHLQYSYDEHFRLRSIQSKFASCDFIYKTDPKRGCDFDIVASDGQKKKYRYTLFKKSKKHDNPFYLTRVDEEELPYTPFKEFGFLLNQCGKNHISYDQMGRVATLNNMYTCSYRDKKTKIDNTLYVFNEKSQLLKAGDLSLEWDEEGKLLKAPGATYIYDMHGNIIWENYTKKSYDSLHHLIKSELFDPEGNLLQEKAWEYDRCFLKRSIDPAGAITRYEYDDRGRKIREIVETEQGELETLFFYDREGKLEKIHTDHVKIKDIPAFPFHDLGIKKYDLLGRLIELYTEDGTVHYTIEYNGRGEPLLITDHIQKCSGTRKYDTLGNLTEETLLNGQTLKNVYDVLGRRLGIILPDESKISYKWEDHHLKEIIRFPIGKNVEYRHLLMSYNSKGFPIIQRLIAGSGQGTFDFDETGKITGIHTRYFEQTRLDEPSFEISQHHSKYATETDGLGRITSFILESKKIDFTYDIWNRRMTKKTYALDGGSWVLEQELHYLYDDMRDIGALDVEDHSLVELRVLAEHPINTGDHAISYELEGKPYLPIFDLEGNPRLLYSILREKIMETYRYTLSGHEEILDYWGVRLEGSKASNPWRYKTQRFDEETGLYYIDGTYHRP